MAKKNQPQLYEDLQLFFEDKEADRTHWTSDSYCEKEHGRLTRWSITCSTELNSYFGREWAGVAQVFRLERTVQKKGVTTTEVVYGLSSLSPFQVDPLAVARLLRAHWAIENRLHWRRDVTLGEDHCLLRTGAAPHVLATLNNTILALMDFLGARNVAEQMRIFDARPQEAIRLLLARP